MDLFIILWDPNSHRELHIVRNYCTNLNTVYRVNFNEEIFEQVYQIYVSKNLFRTPDLNCRVLLLHINFGGIYFRRETAKRNIRK